MHLWITLWALWMVGIVVLNVSRARRSVRRRGRYRRGTAYGSSYDGGLTGTDDFSGTPSHHDSGGSWWSGSDGDSSSGGCDSGSSWGGSDSGSSSSDSGSSCS